MKFNQVLLTICCLSFLFSCEKEDADTNTDPPATDELTRGLIVYLPFNGTINDASGNGNNAVNVGVIAYGSNKFHDDNSALVLNGGYLEVPAKPAFDQLTTFTLYAEIHPSSSDIMSLIAKAAWSNGLQYGFQLATNFNGAANFAIRKRGTCTNAPVPGDWSQTFASGTTVLEPNCWNYVAATYDGTTQKLYVNGKLVGQTQIAAANTEICPGSPIRIGAWWANDPLRFRGKMDEVRIYNRALTQDEIRACYKKS
jgi:hypothetical protein